MPIQFMNDITNSIFQLVNAHSGIFVAIGQQEFRWLATIMLAFFGMEWGFYGWDVHTGFGKFFQIWMTIAFGYLMITFYLTPIPGWGITFPHMIIDKTQALSSAISYHQSENIVTTLGVFQAQMEIPRWYNVIAVISYVWLLLLIWCLQALAFLEVVYGQIAQAVCYLLGPVFIPFFVVPALSRWFWSWLSAFMEYSFFQVVAAAIIYIIGNALLPSLPTGSMSTFTLDSYVPSGTIVFFVGAYMLLQIPRITNTLFSGSGSGGISGAAVALMAKVL